MGFDDVDDSDATECDLEFESLRMGQTSVIGIATDGSFWGFGLNMGNELTLGPVTVVTTPEPLPAIAGLVEVDIGRHAGVGIAPDHSLWEWGTGVSVVGPVDASTDWLDARAASGWKCGRRMDLTLWCWGNYFRGNLGDGSRTDTATPRQLALPPVASYSINTYQACAIDTSGALWCWGDNNGGSVGNGTSGDVIETPGRVGTDVDWISITVGNGVTCGRKTSGTLWCWGQSYTIGRDFTSPVPIQLGTRSDWIDVRTRSRHSCALASDGTVWCFGVNTSGELGQGDTMLYVPPMQVPLPGAPDRLELGGHSVCARIDGRWWCWGRNLEGELGNGSTMNELSPIPRCDRR